MDSPFPVTPTEESRFALILDDAVSAEFVDELWRFRNFSSVQTWLEKNQYLLSARIDSYKTNSYSGLNGASGFAEVTMEISLSSHAGTHSFMVSALRDATADNEAAALTQAEKDLATFVGIKLMRGVDNLSAAEVADDTDGVPASPVPRDQRDFLFVAEISLTHVFPVFYKYYDSNPVGQLTLVNRGDKSVSGVAATLYVPQYMDAPKTMAIDAPLMPGDTRTVDLNALFTNSILEVTEGTRVAASIDLAYIVDGRDYAQSFVETVQVHDRNAMTWDDDRKCAAFITAREPAVLALSNNVVAVVQQLRGDAVVQALRYAIAFHEVLRLIGIAYVTDPHTPYVSLSATTDVVDFLKFPRQTLQYRAGDCDDLSLLYASLFESVGIETALITTPGHLYMAFSLGISPRQGRSMFSQAGSTIELDGKSWVPIEVTERGRFVDAWQTGAREWNENFRLGTARMLPVGEAWEVYEPVGLPAADLQLAMPTDSEIADAFETELSRFIEQEVFVRAERIKERIAASGADPGTVNSLGVLYAQFGLSDEAEAEFLRAIDIRPDYLPATVNLANLKYVNGDHQAALALFERALEGEPDSAHALLGKARAAYALSAYSVARSAYRDLASLDPALASAHTHLESQALGSDRASATTGAIGAIEWLGAREE